MTRSPLPFRLSAIAATALAAALALTACSG